MDIDGFLTSTEFLASLVSLLTTFIYAVFGRLLGM